MAAASSTKRTRKTHTNKPEVKTTRVVQLFSTEYRTDPAPKERFVLTTEGTKVTVERQYRYDSTDDWDACDERYTFLLDELALAVELAKEE